MIVVDANIISYLYLPTSFSVKVDTLFKIDPDWSAPFLWRSEFRNVLALYLRKGLINFDNALKLQEEAESLMERNEFSVSTPHILALVNESKCSAYDCEFVALAHQLNTKLITQDKRILSEFPSVALNIDDFIIQKP